MGGRRIVKYDYLQVTDELLDERAPALARLLSSGGRRVSEGDALRMILRLERHVMRKVDDNAPDLFAEMRARSTLPVDRIGAVLAQATGWPEAKGGQLVDALADEEVHVLDAVEGGWQVRGIPERYGRFANERKASRERTRHNSRARAAGWEPGDGKTWVHQDTGEILGSLRDVIARLNRTEAA